MESRRMDEKRLHIHMAHESMLLASRWGTFLQFGILKELSARYNYKEVGSSFCV